MMWRRDEDIPEEFEFGFVVHWIDECLVAISKVGGQPGGGNSGPSVRPLANVAGRERHSGIRQILGSGVDTIPEER